MANVNYTYFDGYYKDIWRTLIPEELTGKEVEFMISYFGLQPGSRVLDLMCGYGRHLLGLARRGIHVTGVDNLSAYTSELDQRVSNEALPAWVLTQDVLTYHPAAPHDLAICMGNSFNFFDRAELTVLLSRVAAGLRPGGHFLINTWAIAEIMFRQHRERGWSRVGDLKFLTESRMLFQPTRMEIETTVLSPEGVTEVKQAVDYIYSLNELESMFRLSGLTLIKVYSIPGRKEFELGDPRAYIIAQRS